MFSDYPDKDSQSFASSTGETNDSVASSPAAALGHTNQSADSMRTLAKLKPAHLTVRDNINISNGNNELPKSSSTSTVHTSPIKRRASQAEEMLRNEEQGILLLLYIVQ